MLYLVVALAMDLKEIFQDIQESAIYGRVMLHIKQSLRPKGLKEE